MLLDFFFVPGRTPGPAFFVRGGTLLLKNWHPCANVCWPVWVSLGFFKDGFALRPVPAACMHSTVSLYHAVISHQVGSCDLRFQYVQCRCRKIGSTFHVFIHWAREQWGDLSGIPLLMLYLWWWSLSSPCYYSFSSSGSASSWFFFCFGKGTKSPLAGELPRWWRSRCGLLTLFLPDQSKILNHKRE